MEGEHSELLYRMERMSQVVPVLSCLQPNVPGLREREQAPEGRNPESMAQGTFL